MKEIVDGYALVTTVALFLLWRHLYFKYLLLDLFRTNSQANHFRVAPSTPNWYIQRPKLRAQDLTFYSIVDCTICVRAPVRCAARKNTKRGKPRPMTSLSPCGVRQPSLSHSGHATTLLFPLLYCTPYTPKHMLFSEYPSDCSMPFETPT